MGSTPGPERQGQGQEQGYCELEGEVYVKAVAFSVDSASRWQPCRESAGGVNTMASLFPPSDLLRFPIG